MTQKISYNADGELRLEDDVESTKRKLAALVKGTFSDHKTRHQDGGADEIDITGLVGHQYGKNLLENASFESYDIDTGLPDFWSLSATPTLVMAVDTLFPALGGNQLTITGTGAVEEGIAILPLATNWLKVKPSTTYTFSVDYKCTTGDQATVYIRSYNGVTPGTIHANSVEIASTTAVRYSITFTTDTDTTNLTLYLRAKKDGDIVSISHPKLEEGAIATPYIPPNRDRSTVTSIASHATPTPVISAKTTKYFITAQAEAFAPGAPTGTPRDGDRLCYRFLDNGTNRAITWNAIYTAIVAKPTTTTATKTMSVEFEYNATAVKWECIRAAELT